MVYRGVSTFKFLYEEGEIFFVEMNTRLQVKHPVTESVTGVDIVEAQLRIAAGKALWFDQDDVLLSGHAIECRINAEDGTTGLSSPGRIERFRSPTGNGVRLDTHVHDGYVVPSFYDSMIAKLIVHAESRAAAIQAMGAALAELEIDGISTNVALHRALLADPGFVAVGTNIHYLETKLRKAVR